uniref:DENN domain-containing protein 5B n=1 Tax=Haemonchus contortus TaxID=6289 RepID=A0A7I5E7B7_HAECO
MTTGKEEAETTLVDYFVVAGYDPDVGLVIDTTSEDCAWEEENGLTPNSKDHRPPLQRSFVAKILHHFPQKRVGAPFSDEVLSLCMPKGLRFYTEKDVPLNVSLHTFANIREDGSRINGTVITYYEEVRDPRICEAMSLLHTEHVRKLTAGEPPLDRERTHVPPGTVSGGTHTLPRGRRNRTKRISYYDGGGHNTLFMSKTLCLITRLPLVCSTTAILRAIHELLTSASQPPLPLESYIYWILNEIPLPSPGTTLKVSMLDATILVQRPGSRELPIFDDSLASMFQYISVEKFLRLFACFLLEHQILLCSKDYSRLMCVSESLCALAFPFRWQMVYVPILPYSQLKFVEAPVPYVMGWCYEESVPEFLFQSNVCVLDIDTGRTEFPEDLPPFPGAKQLCQEIKSAIERYSTLDDMSKSVISGTTPSGSPAVTNRSNSIRRNEEWSAKRMSRSFDRDDVIDDVIRESVLLSPRPSRADLTPLPLEGVLKNNSTVARVAEIARRAGVLIDVQDLEQELSCKDQYANSPVCKQYFQNARLNNAIRECVLNRIVCMLYSYEHFVVGGQGCTDKETFDESRDSLVCFDKASFLSDQPDSHLAFLAAFLETQMFTSLIDAKILSQWEAPDENLVLFDSRIAAMREKLGLSMVRTPTYESTPPFAHTEELISKREETLDYVVPGPHELAGAVPMRYEGVWPEQINTALLEGAMGLSPAPSPWKQRYPRLRPKQQEAATSRPTSTYGGAGLVGDSAQVAQQQLKFVEQLLRETKGKTKRMLVDKMGKEAVQLGHLDAGITGVEENTLVASFCDLLERIWAHGLIKKQGKSALWSFVLQHQDLEKTCLSTRTMSSSMLTPGDGPRGAMRRCPSLPHCEVPAPVILQPANENDFVGALSEIVESIQRELGKADEENAPAWSRSILRAANFLADKLTNEPKEEARGVLSTAFAQRPPTYPKSVMKKSNSVSDFTNSSWNSEIGANPEVTGSPRRRSQSRPRSPEMGARVVLAPLPTHVAYDLKNVLRMTEIKTDIGYARAFVRLALERKLLHRHLATLLGNNRLLSELYKQYAFVRCEDEREQFLYHILSLNAAQFRCFTNTFTKTKMDYQVVIVTGGWRGSLPAVWVTVGGSLCSSPQINLPANTPLFKFDHKNLGVLSTLRIGHAPGPEKPPKWYLEYVIVRNEITGQMYRFPCGRWFGQGVEDSRWFGNGCDVSLERLLVAEPICDDDGADSAFSTVPNSPARSARRGRVSSRSQTPQRERSPSQSRGLDSTTNRRTRITEIQQILGEAVNSLVKYYYSEKHSKSELAHLLCGERGLVNAIEQAFQFGRHGTVWLFRQPSPWDYVEKVCVFLMDLLRRRDTTWTREQRELITHALRLVRRISERSALGKDAKFHVFVLLTIRDHMLSGFLHLMAWTPITAQLYDEPSFLRTPVHLTYFSRLLDSLNEFNFTLDPSLTYGVV